MGPLVTGPLCVASRTLVTAPWARGPQGQGRGGGVEAPPLKCHQLSTPHVTRAQGTAWHRTLGLSAPGCAGEPAQSTQTELSSRRRGHKGEVHQGPLSCTRLRLLGGAPHGPPLCQLLPQGPTWRMRATGGKTLCKGARSMPQLRASPAGTCTWRPLGLPPA